MPELRRDPVTGRWVIISTERANKPDQFSHSMDQPAPAGQDLKPGEKCPFCEGNEDLTPPRDICAQAPRHRRQ